MARLDEYVFGYHIGKADSSDSYKVVNSFLKLGICSDVTANGEFSLRRRDKARFMSYTETKMHLTLSQPLGLYGFILRSRRQYGVLIALLISVILYVFSSGLVWDVRISGNEILTDYAIEDTLNDLGLSVGVRWGKIDKNTIETELLATNTDIAWISINRRGTVAYVEVIESENIGEEKDNGYPFSNIVADRDGVIEEITVHSGEATVRIGDVVKKGEVLISGVIENENGVSFCQARGSVRASSVTTVSTEMQSEVSERTAQAHKLAELRLVIFNFSINIFKNYRNSENTCDIIEENRSFALFGKYRLPVRVEKAYVVKYAADTRTRSADEMVDAAKRELDGKIYSMFKNADVIKIRTHGEFVGDVYRLTSRVVYTTDIGKQSAIKIN